MIMNNKIDGKMKTEIKTILVPINFCDKSNNALKVATKMAQRHEAKLMIVHMVHTYYLIDRGGKQVIGSETIQESINSAELKLNQLQQELEDQFALDIETKICTENLVDSINNFVQSDDVDLVVMGTSGKQNIKQFILGSNSYNVMLHANCSVLLVPEKFKKTDFKKILFPVRVKHELLQKADLSILLAKKNQGGINLLGVGNPNRLKTLRQAYSEMKGNLLLKSAEYFSEFESSHNSADVIAKAASEKNSDIILLADEDEDSWKSFMADNFFKKMINGTDIPLFIVKSKLKKIQNNGEKITGYDLTLPIPG